MGEEMLDAIRAILPEGWDLDSEGYGLDFLLEAPCGNVIETDGICPCPERHVSPLREQGLI